MDARENINEEPKFSHQKFVKKKEIKFIAIPFRNKSVKPGCFENLNAPTFIINHLFTTKLPYRIENSDRISTYKTQKF